jgi:hypothetical protein
VRLRPLQDIDDRRGDRLIGMKGCCAAAPGKAIPKWDCDGNFDDDSADFFLRVRQINGDKCMPYRVKYRF